MAEQFSGMTLGEASTPGHPPPRGTSGNLSTVSTPLTRGLKPLTGLFYRYKLKPVKPKPSTKPADGQSAGPTMSRYTVKAPAATKREAEPDTTADGRLISTWKGRSHH